MAVRNFTILKVVALLIFCFELLAAAVLTVDDSSSLKESKHILTNSQSHLNFFASLLCEEANGEEGREDKEHKTLEPFTEVSFVFVYQSLDRQDNLPQPKGHFSKIHSGPDFLSLISIYRI